MTLILFGFLFLGISWLGYSNLVLRHALQQNISVVKSLEERLSQVEISQKEELTKDQVEYRDKLNAQYAILFQQVEEKLKSDLDATRAEFEQKLKDDFEEACEQIKFDEIEYKRTITKKRKEFNRKNSKNAKPERIWRYIDEE